MNIIQEFTVARPISEVWAFFHDIPKVASCLPGAEYLGEKGEGKHAGKVSSKIGPFSASFEGEADVSYNEADKIIHAEGKGVDKKGASRGKMVMDCRLEEVGTSTKVMVNADIQLSGTIAQFGRTGLLTEIANVLVADFVRNAEAQLVPAAASEPTSACGPSASTASAPAAPAAAVHKPIGGVSLLLMALKSWLRNLFAGRAA